MEAKKIMIADDEKDICDLIEKQALKRGYSFCCADDGAEALRVFEREMPDLVILDVMMPEINGFDACKSIREHDENVIIFFLSAKSDLVDKSIGFSNGGDDYISKPFSSEELFMRIDAALRRKRVIEANMLDGRGSKSVINTGALEIHLKKNDVFRSGIRVDLTPKEFQILALLANHLGETFTSKSIIEYVWGEEYVEGSTSIAVYIRRIREKIESDPSKPKYLETVWHNGYRLNGLSSDAAAR